MADDYSTMKELIKALLRKPHLFDFARRFMVSCGLRVGYYKNKNKSIVSKYFNENLFPSLHIGCGNHILSGWLNADYFPQYARNVIHLDATKPFPFKNHSYAYIYSEHMIEHLSYSDGWQMLLECNRILKPDGKIRITTPDLAFLIALYNNGPTKLQSDYIKWITRESIKYAPYCHETFVINNFVRDWGHQFIYDESTLRWLMEKVGFKKITRWELGESDDVALKFLENEERLPAGFLRLESFALEGTK